jgi:hypothetical protein
MDAVQALDDDALQLVESSIIPNLKAWGCVQLRFVCVYILPPSLISAPLRLLDEE